MSNKADIQVLREYLWSGSAAVIVGAGFSLNAERKDKSLPLPPKWSEFTNAFAIRILGVQGGTSNELDRVRQYVEGKSALILPQEYEALYGRKAMVSVVRGLINDDNLLPHKVHSELLRLPWADVYTTNYDTLLERAATEVTEYDYRTITLPEQIVGSKNPRIVKLHGTWNGSDKDWIVTEEDYRRYPREYSPFVNMVRQSAMEACLCLVGFSGTDPNFLSWIGWVRDYLGTTQLPIFLMLGYTPSKGESRLLKERNIIAINLFDVFDGEVIAGDYSGALHSLFKYLNPDTSRAKAVPCVSFLELEKEKPKEERMQGLDKLLKQIREYKNSMIGCLVAPHKDRETINQFHVGYQTAFDLIKELNVDAQVEAFELLEWFRALGLQPLQDALYDEYKQLSRDALLRRTKGSLQTIRMTLWQEARERHDNETWAELDSYFSRCQLVDYSAVIYERILWHLAELNLPKVAELMLEWKRIDRGEEWQLKYASCLIYLGEYFWAMQEAQSALRSIRKKVPRGRRVDNKYYLYLEGVALCLIRSLHWSCEVAGETDVAAINKRLDFLAGWGCDPRADIEYFDLLFDRDFKPCLRETTSRRFDEKVKTRHLIVNVPAQGNVACELLRYTEKTGLCKAAAQFLLLSDSDDYRRCKNFFRWHSYAWPQRVRSLNWLLANGGEKFVEIAYSQSVVGCMPSAEIDKQAREILSALEALDQNVSEDFASARSRIRNFYLEVLSRFVSKIKDEELKLEIFDAGNRVFKGRRQHFSCELSELKQRFLRRVLCNMATQTAMSRLSLILEHLSDKEQWPLGHDRMELLAWLPNAPQSCADVIPAEVSSIVDRILREFTIGVEDETLKECAIKLAHMENFGVMSKIQKSAFANKLLSLAESGSVLDATLTHSYTVKAIASEFGAVKASHVLDAIVKRGINSFGEESGTGANAEIRFYEDVASIIGFQRPMKSISLSEELRCKIFGRLTELIRYYLNRQEELSGNLLARSFEHIEDRLMELDRTVSEMVLPEIENESMTQLRQLLEDDSRLDQGLFPLTTMVLLYARGEVDSLMKFIHSIELFDEESLGSNAIDAVGRFSYALRKNDVLCGRLVDFLVSVMRHRADKAVVRACYSLSMFIQQHPKCVAKIGESDIRTLAKQTRPRSSARFPEDDLVDYRIAAAFLAGAVRALSEKHRNVCDAFIVEGEEFFQVVRSWNAGIAFGERAQGSSGKDRRLSRRVK